MGLKSGLLLKIYYRWLKPTVIVKDMHDSQGFSPKYLDN
jgi:hypothetical protein